MRLAANLSTQFASGTWPGRVARAAGCGFSSVEAQWPYDECSPADLRAALDEHGVSIELINAPVGGDASTFGRASVPGRSDAFRRSIVRALAYAGAIRCPRIHVLAGVGTGEGARDALLENLAWASDAVGRDATLVIEAINRLDVPGYHLAGNDDAVLVLEQLGQDNVGLMFDFYHSYRSGEVAADVIRAHFPRIVHVQISDHPGRGEPGTGDIDYRAGIDALRESGYAGAVGCEFRPSGEPEDCLDWSEPLGFVLAR